MRANASVRTTGIRINRYSPLAQFFHWVVAALVIVTIPIGLTMRYHWAAKPTDKTLALIHMGIGLTVLVLMVLRLLRRWINPPPPFPGQLSPAVQAAARANHYLFYLLLLAMPVFGIIFVEAKGHAVSWFGVSSLPMFIGKSASLHHWFAWLHFWGGFVVIAVILAHLAGVFRHDVMRHDHVVERMLPGRRD